VSKQSEAAAIRRLEAEYSPRNERFELEDWIAEQLFNTYNDIEETESILFRFREAVFIYVRSNEIFNATRLVNNKAVDYSILLSGFLHRNYGVSKLANNKDIEKSLILTELDFELMSMQIVDDFIYWYEEVSLVKEVLEGAA